MTNENAIDEAIRKTVSAVETIAPKAWAMAVAAQRLDGWVEIVQLVLAVAVGGAIVTMAWRVTEKSVGESNDFLMKANPLVVMPGLCVFIAVGVCLLQLPGAIAHVVSPEVYAARALMGR